MKALWWIKRDPRLLDNDALIAAVAEADSVLPAFVFEPKVLAFDDYSKFHANLQREAIVSLRKNLRHHGADLYVGHGDVISLFKKVRTHYDFDAIYAHEETGLAHTFKRDKQVKNWCEKHGVKFTEVQNKGVIRGPYDRDDRLDFFHDYIEESCGSIPSITLNAEAAHLAGSSQIPSFSSLGFESVSHLQNTSERAAHQTLADFLLNRGHKYRGNMSSMNTAPNTCSRLSVHLAWGTLSLRTAFQKTNDRLKSLKASSNPQSEWAIKSLQQFKSRLYWHAHFIQKLEDQISIEKEPLNPAFESVAWENDEKLFAAWWNGTTGYPMIDAAMRYFQHTGYLNFRSRALVVSFACHTLHLSWRRILYPMARLMADYVPGIHVPQVQMQAGVTGINTIRVYNPKKQIKDHDSEAVFVKEWVKELGDLSADEIINIDNHRPDNYPKIVERQPRTKNMKDQLWEIKQSAEAKQFNEAIIEKHASRKRS